MPKEKKDKKPKDPNAPKKALAPYMIFCKENREKIKQEIPDIQFTEIAKELGKRWSQLTDSGKKPFVKKAEADKKRYQDEMARYKPPSPSDE